MRNKILTGAIERFNLEGRIHFDNRFLPRMEDAGALVELPEDASLSDAVNAIRTAGERVLVLPNSFHPTRWEAERGVKDVTEAYDSFSYPRRVQAAVQAHIAELEAKGQEVPPWLQERAARQHALTKGLARELGFAPMDFFNAMMQDPIPVPDTGVGLPRARERAKEARGNIGYTFGTLDKPYTNVLIPWYAIVEGAANAARQFLASPQGRDIREKARLSLESIPFARVSANIRRRPQGTFYLTGTHEPFPNSTYCGERYRFELSRIPFGNSSSKTARLQEFVSGPRGNYSFCGCPDSRYRGRENTWQAHPVAKACKHEVSGSYWMQAIGKHPFEDSRWHANMFLLPIREEGKSRYSEALRIRRILRSRTLLRDLHGSAEPVPLLTQSLLYGAINQHLHQERGCGLFMPGIMDGHRLASLAKQEAKLLQDTTYQRI